MENPCKECLVRAICTTVCQDLDYFATIVFTNNGNAIRTWLKYELRPNILKRYNRVKI